jgi:hypothetical protein
MNQDLVLELDKQARVYADSIPDAGYEVRIWRNHYVQKFAELIVLECYDIASDGDGILEHFGVEK